MEIERSSKPVTFQLISVSIISLLLLVFTTQIFTALDNIIPWDWSGLTRIARLLVGAAAILGLFLVWRNSKNESYVLNGRNLTINKKKRNQDTYNLSSVTSISVKQTFIGRNYGYGNVIINTGKPGEGLQITLNNVSNPRDVAKQIGDTKTAA